MLASIVAIPNVVASSCDIFQAVNYFTTLSERVLELIWSALFILLDRKDVRPSLASILSFRPHFPHQDCSHTRLSHISLSLSVQRKR